MTERPILFSAPMVRAILGDLKTQTRRIVKGQASDWLAPDMFTPEYVADPGTRLSPYGFMGDRIWVRETLKRGAGRRWAYGADGAPVTLFESDPNVPGMIAWAAHKQGDTCVSIHMPRWASRILLEVVDVRIERLNDCSEADATAEGTQEPSLVPILGAFWSSRDGYAKLWEHINGAGSWAANPWVWVITFKRVQP
jgi:hypothetical protein